MGWEKRKNGRYYYTKTRIGSRVVSSYVGNGRTAELIGQLSGIYREEARQTHESVAAEIEAMDAEDRAADELFSIAVDLMKSELMAEGFHQHDRGEWRKTRIGKGNSKTQTGKG